MRRGALLVPVLSFCTPVVRDARHDACDGKSNNIDYQTIATISNNQVTITRLSVQ